MGTMGPREGVTFGVSTGAQRDAWSRRRHAVGTPEERREANRLHYVADAFATGWLLGRGHRFTTEAWEFGEEYEHAAWLYESERVGSRKGYGRAWEEFMAARGIE